MKFASLYSSASGFSRYDYCFIGNRFDAAHGFSRAAGESWLCQRTASDFLIRYGGAGWYTGCYYSPQRTAWLTESHGTILRFPNLPARVDRVEQYEVPGLLSGIWGLGDDFVVAWGERDERGVMYRFGGERWEEMPSPGPLVLAVHGNAPDLLVAAGSGGRLSHWNGSRWQRVSVPTAASLAAVFVESRDEIYAVGGAGSLLEGSIDGVSETASCPGAMFGVVKWRGDVWVGAGEHGLFRRDHDALVCVKPNVAAEALDAREDLIISTPSLIAWTEDGATYKAFGRDTLLQLLDAQPPAWRS